MLSSSLTVLIAVYTFPLTLCILLILDILVLDLAESILFFGNDDFKVDKFTLLYIFSYPAVFCFIARTKFFKLFVDLLCSYGFKEWTEFDVLIYVTFLLTNEFCPMDEFKQLIISLLPRSLKMVLKLVVWTLLFCFNVLFIIMQRYLLIYFFFSILLIILFL